MRITDLNEGNNREEVIARVVIAIEATGYTEMAKQFKNEPDKRERIARIIGDVYAARINPERGAKFTELAMTVAKEVNHETSR